MASEWIEAPLSEVADIFDGPHATPSKTDDGPIFLGISNLARGRLDLGGTEHLSEEDFMVWTRRVLPRAGDVVFSYETRIGESALIPEGLRCCLGRRMGLLRAKEGRIDPRFLGYAYLGREFQETLQTRTIHGSTVDRVPLIEMGSFPLRFPTLLCEQRAVAHILGTLDDKIELNRRMSETLEAMARALFKSWFVDFDPVRAKAEGRDPGLPKPLADLFPARFVDSMLGYIPDLWEVTLWEKLVTLRYGKGLSGYCINKYEYPVYGTNGIIGSWTTPLCHHPGIIIGRKGAYREIRYSDRPFFVIDTAFYIEPKISVDLRWAYYDLVRHDINSMDSGSAIPSTSREDIYKLPVLLPPLAVQRAFSSLLEPNWLRQSHNNEESHTLAALRDALLPKLISGELRVRDAERVVGTVL